jgi:hypothetical protein
MIYNSVFSGNNCAGITFIFMLLEFKHLPRCKINAVCWDNRQVYTLK